MTNGRDAVLRSIRASLAAARLPPADASAPVTPAPAAPPPDELVAPFTRELAAAGGTVHGPLETRAAADFQEAKRRNPALATTPFAN